MQPSGFCNVRSDCGSPPASCNAPFGCIAGCLWPACVSFSMKLRSHRAAATHSAKALKPQNRHDTRPVEIPMLGINSFNRLDVFVVDLRQAIRATLISWAKVDRRAWMNQSLHAASCRRWRFVAHLSRNLSPSGSSRPARGSSPDIRCPARFDHESGLLLIQPRSWTSYLTAPRLSRAALLTRSRDDCLESPVLPHPRNDP